MMASGDCIVYLTWDKRNMDGYIALCKSMILLRQICAEQPWNDDAKRALRLANRARKRLRSK